MSEASREAALAALLARAGLSGAAATPLAGDASTRRYFRVESGGRTAVLMDCGGELPPEDDGRGQDAFAFARWQRFYRDIGLRVPEILAMDRASGLVLLEDLGDELLQRRVVRAGPEACERLYERAVDVSRTIAEEGTERFVPDATDSDDPLVPRRLAVELDLFLALAAAVDVPEGPPLEAAARALDETSGALADARALLHRLCEDVHAASSSGLALCHRDYHARNLLVVPGDGGVEDLAVIDFQDTRRGPRAYDMASLAHDPYVELPEALIATLVARGRPSAVSLADWQREVDLAAGQRLLKAAGTYCLLGRAGRGDFARYLPVALSRAKLRLAAWPPREELWRALADCGIAVP